METHVKRQRPPQTVKAELEYIRRQQDALAGLERRLESVGRSIRAEIHARGGVVGSRLG